MARIETSSSGRRASQTIDPTFGSRRYSVPSFENREPRAPICFSIKSEIAHIAALNNQTAPVGRRDFNSLAESVLKKMRECDPRLTSDAISLDDRKLEQLTQRLTHLLHDVDPMGTSCAINLDMEDEYECEAFHIAALMGLGVSLHEAMSDVFGFWFWEGRLEERWGEQGLYELIAWIRDCLDAPPDPADMPALHRELCLGILPQLPVERDEWSYAEFMQTAPVQLDPQADLVDIGVIAPNAFSIDVDEGEDACMPGWYMPRPGAPDRANVLPWLHATLFEKARRRTPPVHRMNWEPFRAQVLSSFAAKQVTPR